MYFRVSIQGTQGSFEVWSINPVYDPTAEFDSWSQDIGQQMAVAAKGVAIPAGILSCWASTTKATKIRVEGRSDSTDKLMGYAEAAYNAPVSGTGTMALPLQAAIVTTLLTATPGARGRGRLYVPATGVQLIAPDGRINSPTPATIRDGMNTWLSSLEDAMGNVLETYNPLVGLNLAIRSKTAKTTPHVTTVRVGDIVDTQRRRRDSLPEVYSSVAYPPAG